VGTGLVGAPECGDVMKLQMKINPVPRSLKKPSQDLWCGSAIASSSLATEWVRARRSKRPEHQNTDIVRELSLPPVKIHCSVLAEMPSRRPFGD